jgi:hypothetical protein
LDIIKALEDAMNHGDTDAALDLFVDEGLRYHVWGAAAEDKDSLRYCLDFYIGIGNPDNTYRDCQTEGDKVTCTWDTYDGVCYEAFGISVLHFHVTFTFQDHRIRGMVGDIVSGEKATLEAAIAKKNAWAAVNLPEKFREFQSFFEPSGRSGREFAELDLEICAEYLEAMSQ